MVAMSWGDRFARLPVPEDQLVDGLARALYMTHWREPAPTWERASEAVRDWVNAQAREGLIYLRAVTRRSR
jgi:hypothetical protein